jgi:ADP-ribose pyrophosphatase
MTEYTHPSVFTEGVQAGWAEAETNPTRIDWPARQAAALLPFQVVNGRPVSPGPSTGIRYGRNGLGLWGENPMADALVTCRLNGEDYVLLIQRQDTGQWAIPGGAIDPGENPGQAALRELQEETGLWMEFDASIWESWSPRWVADPRGSDEAWAVTVVTRIALGVNSYQWRELPYVKGGDDATLARWQSMHSLGSLLELGTYYPPHVPILRELLEEGQR